MSERLFPRGTCFTQYCAVKSVMCKNCMKQERKSRMFCWKSSTCAQNLPGNSSNQGRPVNKFAKRASRAAGVETREADVNFRRGHVDMAGRQAQICPHVAEGSRADCSPVLQKCKHQPLKYQQTSIPDIFQKIQVMRERRGVRIAGLIEDVGRGWSIGDTNAWEMSPSVSLSTFSFQAIHDSAEYTDLFHGSV